MIRNFTHIFAGILFLALSNMGFADEVKLELKKVDDGIAMVFYHDRWNILTPSMVGNQGRIRSEKPADLKYISDTSKVVSSIKATSKNVIDFKLKPEYKFVGNIYGENLVAFKLKEIKPSGKEQTQKEVKQLKEAPQKLNTSDTSASIIDNKNTKQITFPFAENDVGAAIFRRGRDLWVVFDKRKHFFLKKNNFVDSYSQFSDPYNTILKITLKDNLYPTVSKNGGNWVLSLSAAKSTTKNHLKAETLSESLVSIKEVGKISNIITVRDSSVGDVIKIAPTKLVGNRIAKEESKLDYKILESGQGIAISLVSDQVKTKYNEKTQSLDIISTYALGQSIAGGDAKASEPLLSFELKEIDEASYLQTKSYFQNNLLVASEDEEKAAAIYDLAKFYFTHTMYHESLGMLNQISKHSEKLHQGKEQMLMRAIAMTKTHQEDDARNIYTELKQNFAYDPYIHEIELWDRLNEYQMENKTADMIADSRNLVDAYPDEIYWRFIFAQLDILSNKKDTKSIDALMKSLRRTKDISTNNRIKYYKAKYFYLLNQVNLAQNILEEVKQNAQNGKEFLMADLYLVRILYEQRRIDWISAVQRLNSLRFVWRGDKYEHQLLMAAAMAYQQNNDVINAIRTYKYILEAFGKNSSDNNFFITQQIVDLYRRIFLSDEMQELDDFSVVALFYEFKDYTPIGADGDRVVLGIAKRMLNLDLLEMAGSILEHQVMYRLRGTERMVTANHLALVLLMDRKPEEALNVLNDTDNENFGFAEHQSRTLLKANALIDMEKYDDALSYIGDEGGMAAEILKSEIFFRSFRWAEFIKFAEPNIKSKIKEGDVIDGDEVQKVLRLAIAYSMLNRVNDLGYLQQNIITENQELKKVLEFLKTSNAPIDPHQLDKMIGIDTMQNFLANYRKLLFE